MIVLGFNDSSTRVGHLCRLPEKGERDRRNSRGDKVEGQERKRNETEREETEDIYIKKKNTPLPFPATRIASLAQL